MYKFFHFQKLKSEILVVWLVAPPPTILFKIWKNTTDSIIPLYAYRVGTGSRASHLYISVISEAFAMFNWEESMLSCQYPARKTFIACYRCGHVTNIARGSVKRPDNRQTHEAAAAVLGSWY
jgi:hypothetical protein